jgi:hypothetical protein
MARYSRQEGYSSHPGNGEQNRHKPVARLAPRRQIRGGQHSRARANLTWPWLDATMWPPCSHFSQGRSDAYHHWCA